MDAQDKCKRAGGCPHLVERRFGNIHSDCWWICGYRPKPKQEPVIVQSSDIRSDEGLRWVPMKEQMDRERREEARQPRHVSDDDPFE